MPLEFYLIFNYNRTKLFCFVIPEFPEFNFYASLIHVLLAANKLTHVSHLMVQAKHYLINFHNMRYIVRSWGTTISFICPIKEFMCSGTRHENLKSWHSHLEEMNTFLLTFVKIKQRICKCVRAMAWLWTEQGLYILYNAVNMLTMFNICMDSNCSILFIVFNT